MIKRFGKTKKSKQGAILVIVVLILALAMIFIASAMMLTQATRHRLYDNTLSSQARLTVTSASEVFLEALDMQEINDAQLDSMIAGMSPHADNEKIKMIIDDIPGMTSSPDNCTYLDLYRDATNNKIVYCDFKTVIGDTTENVRIILEEETIVPSYSGHFKNQIDIANSVGKTELRFTNGLGMVPNSTEFDNITDNTILFRNAALETTSDSVFYSDLVFASGTAQFGGGNKYYGRMIFLDQAQMGTRSSFNAMNGDFYFIGNSGNTLQAFNESCSDGWGNITSQNFFFSNRPVQSKSCDNNGKVRDLLKKSDSKCYFVGNTGATVACTFGTDGGKSYNLDNKLSGSGNLSGDFKTRLDLYKAYNYNTPAGAFPNSATHLLAKLNPTGETKTIAAGTTLEDVEYGVDGTVYSAGTTVPSDVLVIKNPYRPSFPSAYKNEDGTVKDGFGYTEATIASKAATNNGVVDLNKSGCYYIGAGTAQPASNSAKPIVVAIDGSKDIVVYFGAGTHTLNKVVFATYNVQADRPVVFILEKDAKLNFNYDAKWSAENSYLCTCGFLSMKERNFNSAVAARDYIYGHPYQSEYVANERYSGKAGYKYSKFYDAKHLPTMYIIGVGNNLLSVGDIMIIEAYVGLYGNSTLGHGNAMSKDVAVYGRIEADKFGQGDNPTGHFCMPYCPAPSDLDDVPAVREAKSKYKVKNEIYYYE